jgi:hypothetical protein
MMLLDVSSPTAGTGAAAGGHEAGQTVTPRLHRRHPKAGYHVVNM